MNADVELSTNGPVGLVAVAREMHSALVSPCVVLTHPCGRRGGETSQWHRGRAWSSTSRRSRPGAPTRLGPTDIPRPSRKAPWATRRRGSGRRSRHRATGRSPARWRRGRTWRASCSRRRSTACWRRRGPRGRRSPRRKSARRDRAPRGCSMAGRARATGSARSGPWSRIGPAERRSAPVRMEGLRTCEMPAALAGLLALGTLVPWLQPVSEEGRHHHACDPPRGTVATATHVFSEASGEPTASWHPLTGHLETRGDRPQASTATPKSTLRPTLAASPLGR